MRRGDQRDQDNHPRGDETPSEKFGDLRMAWQRGPLEQLRGWFERDLTHPRWDEVRVRTTGPDEASIEFTTRRFTYRVDAEVDGGAGYLGCTCTANGERRGRDLPDGPLAESTWLEILAELVDQEGDDAVPMAWSGRRGCPARGALARTRTGGKFARCRGIAPWNPAGSLREMPGAAGQSIWLPYWRSTGWRNGQGT